MGPVVTVCGAANLGISFMAVSSRTIRREDGRAKGRMRPLGPFAGMTRIRFKGFGLSPSQPRVGTPLEHNECGPHGSVCQLARKRGWLAAFAVSLSCRVLRRPTRSKARPGARLHAYVRRSAPQDGRDRERVLSRPLHAYAIGAGPRRQLACKARQSGRRNDETPPPFHTPERTMAWSSADASSDRRLPG